VTAPVRQLKPEAAEAIIERAEIAAGHDGTAELALSIRYENGNVGQLVVDADTGFAVMRACGAADLQGLIGRSWREVSKGLSNV
jgi:hypothetical protein